MNIHISQNIKTELALSNAVMKRLVLGGYGLQQR